VRTYQWIRKFRVEKSGTSCRGFSKMIGIDCGNYNKYETGKLIPGDDFLWKFSQELKLNETERALLAALVSCDKFLQLAIREDEK
jgi:transcriptional regulator with XRE-family HTH domain